MDIDVNLWGVLAATVSAMVVGSVWYSQKVFGKEWMKLSKMTEKKAKKGAPIAMSAMVVFAALTALVLAHMSFVVSDLFEDVSYSEAALLTAVWAWVGFTASAHISNGLFEQRPPRLILINAGNSLVTLVVMGLVIGWVGL